MLVGLVKFMFWFFLISYLLRILARIFAPILLKRFANKMQDRFQQQYGQQHQNPQNPTQEEGKVTLEKTKPSTQTKSDEVGDYVDFEEVDE
ncbi:MAG TPA: DUF4834 family protein [Flavobacteriales bacterium]|jgi:hypothetical protein|nr:DUF4834 family protein [Flavobacteriales bacterium]|tara:strand:+ start:344 stop:616 length:273 start_codon:yes stop_codon:yes gene_type:complete